MSCGTVAHPVPPRAATAAPANTPAAAVPLHVPFLGPYGRLICYSYHTAHSGSDQIKAGDFLFTDFLFQHPVGRMPCSALIYLNLLPPTSHPYFFSRALEVKALSVWFSCTQRAIVAPPCMDPDRAIYCRRSGYVAWRCNRSLCGHSTLGHANPALLCLRLQRGSCTGCPGSRPSSRSAVTIAEHQMPPNSDHIRANRNGQKQSASDSIFLPWWFGPPILVQPRWAAIPGAGRTSSTASPASAFALPAPCLCISAGSPCGQWAKQHWSPALRPHKAPWAGSLAQRGGCSTTWLH